MLIITYTSTHNHPDPTTLLQQPKQSKTKTIEEQEHIEEEMINSNNNKNKNKSTITNDQMTNEENYHYLQSPIDQEDPFKLHTEINHADKIDILLEEEPLCYAKLKNLSASKSEELDFFDELEELPMSSSFLHFTRSIFSDERIPVAPS